MNKVYSLFATNSPWQAGRDRQDWIMDKGLLLGIFLIPFSIAKKLGPAVITSTEILFLLIFVVWVIKLWKKKSRLIKTALDIPILTFLLFTTISFLYSRNMQLGFKELVQFIGIFSLFYLLVNNLKENSIKKVILLLLINSSIVSLIAIYQYFTQAGRVLSPFVISVASTFQGQPNTLGAYLGIIIPLMAGLSIYARGREKSFLLLSLPFLFLALFFSFSRGAWLGVMIGLLIIFSLKDRRFFKFSLIIIGLFLLVNFLGKTDFLTKGFYFFLNLKRTSFQERLLLTSSAFKMIKAYPFLGVGPGNFSLVLGEYASSVKGNPLVHNFILQLGAENGLLALGAFFWLIIVYFKVVFKGFVSDSYGKGLRLGLVGSMSSLMVNSLFEYPFLHGIQEPFILIMALSIIGKAKK